MKKNLPKWVREKGEILQEISQDISWYSEKLKDKAKKTLKGMELPQFHPHAPEVPEHEKEADLTDFFPVTNSQDAARSLREELDWAIHRAYYKEGGFRYFGTNLTRYVKVVLPSETSLEEMWAAGYNSSIQPMLRQLEKLEKELTVAAAHSDLRMPDLANRDLLERMWAFHNMAYQQRLHTISGWDAEAYRQALQHYTMELNRQLLEPYQLTEDD